jgi:hypothetical protein
LGIPATIERSRLHRVRQRVADFFVAMERKAGNIVSYFICIYLNSVFDVAKATGRSACATNAKTSQARAPAVHKVFNF